MNRRLENRILLLLAFAIVVTAVYALWDVLAGYRIFGGTM